MKLNLNFLKKKKKAEKKEIDIFDIRNITQKKIAPEKHKLQYFLERAGISIDPHGVAKFLFNVCIGINIIVSIYLVYFFAKNYSFSFYNVLGIMFFSWIFVFIFLLLFIWLMFYFMLDLRIFKRKVIVEDVLPDFLQLTATNIKAGMPIDRALWYAVRPRFGILAKEIETVAKETISGTDLEVALLNFTKKYDSDVLKRSINLLIEGINAGGEIGDLLNKIALDIEETHTMKKEMGASVMTYVIFISFATLLAAPFLFGLAYELVSIVQTITSGIDLSQSAGSGMSSSFSFTFSEQSIKLGDFKIFAILCLIITSFFSAVIVSTIRKGNVKEGVKFIPIFIAVTVTIFLMSIKLLSFFLSGLF